MEVQIGLLKLIYSQKDTKFYDAFVSKLTHIHLEAGNSQLKLIGNEYKKMQEKRNMEYGGVDKTVKVHIFLEGH